MTNSSERRLIGVLGGLVASLVLATGALAAAPTWQAPLELRVTSRFVGPTDADFSGHAVVLAWNEQSTSASRVAFVVSNNAGTSFGPLHLVAGASDAAAAICGSQANVVWAKRNSPSSWSIERASGPVSGGPFVVEAVATSSVELSEPDVACANGRIFVSWREQETEETVRMFVASALMSDGAFGSPMALGVSDRYYPTGLALAGSGNNAYAAFVKGDGDLRLKHWTIGAGPGYPLSSGPASIVGPGKVSRPTYAPGIDADGDTVAITWGKCSSTLARVSTDAGATWGVIRHVVEFGCYTYDAGSGPGSIAVRGSRIALVYNIGAIPNFSQDSLARTTNGFSTVDESALGEHQHHIVGYVVVDGKVKLGDVYSTKSGHRIKFRRQM